MASILAGAACTSSAVAQRQARPSFRATPALKAGVRPRVHSARRAVRVVASAAVSTTVDVKSLQAKFGKDAAVQVVEGRGGLPTVTLKAGSGATAEVLLFGGCVISWKNSAGQEQLYIRPDAVFDKSKPVSGGIPHCFPQFGPGAIQLHGFARNVDWELAATAAGSSPSATLVLTDSDYTRAMWPRAFKVEYTVTLEGEQLRTEVKVHNTGDQAFEFTASLHSYFGVTDIDAAAVRGLQGLEYLDRVADAKHPTVHKELREAVVFNGPMDAVYRGAKGNVVLSNGKGTVTLANTNWPDVVVWTPWTAMEACYREFVCVENAQFASVAVAPGQAWAASTAFSSAVDPLEAFCGDNPDAEECRVYDE